jgi:thioesterase domain-containing protein
MAYRLIEAGASVELVILIDTLAPEGFRWRGRIAARDRLLRGESLARRAREQADLVRNVFRIGISLAHGERRLQSWPRGFDDPWDQAGALRLSRRYRPPKLAAPVTVLHTPRSEILMGGAELGWGRYVAGPITTRTIPGTHASIFSAPEVNDLAAGLADELANLDSAAPDLR